MSEKYKVKADKLNIRSGPGEHFDIWDSFTKGEVFDPVPTEGWIPVEMQDKTVGWVSAQYVEKVDVAPPVPPAPGDDDWTTESGTIKALIKECLRQDVVFIPQIAYILATVEWETGNTFKPVREAYWKSEEWRQSNLRYYPYYGRGFVQLTWKANYEKYATVLGLDLVDNPDLALEPTTAAFILVHGMRWGAFTGKKLSNYVKESGVDYFNARRVVNVLDRAEEIKQLALKHEAALKAGEYNA